MDGNNVDPAGGCPVMHGGNTEMNSHPNRWWPNALNLDILHQHGAHVSPMDADYDHRKAVKALRAAGHDVEMVDVREMPVGAAALSAWALQLEYLPSPERVCIWMHHQGQESRSVAYTTFAAVEKALDLGYEVAPQILDELEPYRQA